MTTLHYFKGGTDGSEPYAGLVGDPATALYGTTAGGGASANNNNAAGLGTVFEVQPPTNGGTDWTETVLYRMSEGTLESPRGSLLVGPDGVLYGTAKLGGSAGVGGVFSLQPPAKGKTNWKETTIYNFQGGSDGGYPVAGLYMDASGALYGTTLEGGGGYNASACNGSPDGLTGCGTVFKLTPPTKKNAPWSETVLYAFTGDGPDGLLPYSALVGDASGNLYGTTCCSFTQEGPAAGNVFMISPPGPGGVAWTETTLYQFSGADGANPEAGVVFGPGGVLYGTTFTGGTNDLGTVFLLSPPAPGQTDWTESVVYNFLGGADGEYPVASVLLNQEGDIFGTTQLGGSLYGTVFEVAP